MEKKEITLCAKCAAIMSGAFIVKRIRTGIDKKVDCEQCRRHRFGGKYEVKKKD